MDKNTEIRLPYFVPIESLFRFFLGLFFFSCLALVAGDLYPWPRSFSGDLMQTLGVELLMLAFFGFLFFKPSGFSLNEEGLCYMKNFLWKQEVAWHSIRKVQMAVGENRTYYMDVFHEDQRAPNPLPIFLKPYTEKGVSVFVAMLETKAAHAELDEKTRKMKKGVFPSVFFGDTQKAKKDLPLYISYLLVGASLFFLPVVFTISDARILFGLPSVLFLFLLLAFKLDQFQWQEVRRHLARTLYSVAYYGMGLLLYVLVKRWLSSETIIFKNVFPLLVGCPLYFILALALSRQQKEA